MGRSQSQSIWSEPGPKSRDKIKPGRRQFQAVADKSPGSESWAGVWLWHWPQVRRVVGSWPRPLGGKPPLTLLALQMHFVQLDGVAHDLARRHRLRDDNRRIGRRAALRKPCVDGRGEPLEFAAQPRIRLDPAPDEPTPWRRSEFRLTSYAPWKRKPRPRSRRRAIARSPLWPCPRAREFR